MRYSKSMKQYLALLRGINVGGNTIIAMAELRQTLQDVGLQNVRTYIQTGNIFFESDKTDTVLLAKDIEAVIQARFNLQVPTVVFTKHDWQAIIAAAPKWWGTDQTMKHNIIVLLPAFDMKQVVEAVGELKPDIEAMQAGEGVLYQALSLQAFGRTTGGKLAGNPIYKRMTIRNYNTATKLLQLFAA